MRGPISILIVLVFLFLVVALAWPLAGVATPQADEAEPKAGDFRRPPLTELLPPDLTPPDGVTFHYVEREPAALPNTGVIAPGVYAARDYYNLDPAVYPIVGSHRTFYWNELEPAKDNYAWYKIHDFIARNAALGKKSAFGISTYDGIHGSRIGVPDWFIAEYGGFGVVTCPDGHQIPRYWNSRYLAEYGDFVADMGAASAGLDGNPNLGWVAIGTGLYGENQPCADYYDTCLQNEWLTPVLWANTSFEITQMYVDAFSQTPVLFQYAPVYQGDWQRKDCSDYAASRGAGLMHDGLVPDREKAYGSNVACDNQAGHWDPIAAHWRNVPIAFETYRQYLPTHVDVYWGFLNGLAKHADYFNAGKCLLNLCNDQLELIEPLTPRTENFAIFRFANRYAGKTVHNTPSVWIALRETELRYCPDRGNFSFWLYQDDSGASGRTVPEWNVGVHKEGRYTRRTDQSTGNYYMYFDIDDAYLYGGVNSVEITVRYYDQGLDRWQLHYHAPDNVYKLAGEIAKHDSREWLTATFRLDDAAFANGQSGGNDFRIDCLTDGNEYIHFVDVRKVSPEVAHIALGEHYNLVSIPVVPGDTSLGAVLSSVEGRYTKVYAYVDGAWKQYIVGAPPFVNTLTNLDEKRGFWIYMSSSATLSVPGARPGTTYIPLRPGPNLVGFPRAAAQPIAEALASIAGKYTKVYAYVEGAWKQHIVGAPPFVNTLTELEPGRGYWIYVTEATTWIVNN